MQSEHTLSADEEDAFKAPRFFHWKPGERKAIKAAAHRKDRRAARRDVLCVDTFDRFPTIADLYEEQAMRRATRTARRDALIATIEERAATLPPGPI